LSLYASPEEIEAAIAALQKLWTDYGRQMKAAAGAHINRANSTNKTFATGVATSTK